MFQHSALLQNFPVLHLQLISFRPITPTSLPLSPPPPSISLLLSPQSHYFCPHHPLTLSPFAPPSHSYFRHPLSHLTLTFTPITLLLFPQSYSNIRPNHTLTFAPITLLHSPLSHSYCTFVPITFLLSSPSSPTFAHISLFRPNRILTFSPSTLLL